MKAAVPLLCLVSICASAQDSKTSEPKVERIVVQDDNARIEELRVRGVTQKVTVKPKNAAEYEIVVAPGGRDPSVGRSGNKDAAGQRVWNVLKF